MTLRKELHSRRFVQTAFFILAVVFFLTNCHRNAFCADEDALAVSPFPSPAEKIFWKKAIKKLWMRPGCCGACPLFSHDDFKAVAKVIVSTAKNTKENQEIWSRYNRRLVYLIKRQDIYLYNEYKKIVEAK